MLSSRGDSTPTVLWISESFTQFISKYNPSRAIARIFNKCFYNTNQEGWRRQQEKGFLCFYREKGKIWESNSRGMMFVEMCRSKEFLLVARSIKAVSQLDLDKTQISINFWELQEHMIWRRHLTEQENAGLLRNDKGIGYFRWIVDEAMYISKRVQPSITLRTCRKDFQSKESIMEYGNLINA